MAIPVSSRNELTKVSVRPGAAIEVFERSPVAENARGLSVASAEQTLDVAAGPIPSEIHLIVFEGQVAAASQNPEHCQTISRSRIFERCKFTNTFNLFGMS